MRRGEERRGEMRRGRTHTTGEQSGQVQTCPHGKNTTVDSFDKHIQHFLSPE